MTNLKTLFFLAVCIPLLTRELHASNSHENTHQATTHQAATNSPAPSSPQHHNDHERKKGKVSSEESYKKLIAGHKRYLNMSLRKDGKSVKDRQRLATGQEPHAIILSCSDSRVPPEIIFDQALGEIFVVRTAGQALDSSAIASIEYAISHLGSNLIVVMGHESCGAVKAALGTLNGEDAGSVSLNKLVGDLHPRLKKFSGLPQSDRVVVESWSNVNGVATDLRERSKIIDDAVKSGDVEIRKALYHLGSGEVDWRD